MQKFPRRRPKLPVMPPIRVKSYRFSAIREAGEVTHRPIMSILARRARRSARNRARRRISLGFS